ncbi:MAG: RNA polymerase II transcription factor B subunit 1 [Vezdaea aestivalis]|nr:MAG: RNA polymerase II transcription factor B subunit 1 [Vezdaea aestivalis]
MTQLQGAASYRKKSGNLVFSPDVSSLTWTPTDSAGAVSVLESKVIWITNLQATPATHSKVMLKVSVRQPESSADETHIFTFTSTTRARTDADALKGALSTAIQKVKANAARPTATGADGADPAQSAAMAIASAVSSNPHSNDWLDNARLGADIKLQQSLLKSDPHLQKTFIEALKTKPSSVSHAHFTTQFWSSRMHLLRAHAIEKSQSRGAYNVLSTMKPVSVDNEITMKINPDQIQLIFQQHPLVKRVYDENVPKLNEAQFWSQFFTSRLLKKLKGEKIIDADLANPLLDRYLQDDTNSRSSNRNIDAQVPHFIDLEGNEENHSQRKGNQPDWTMRPSTVEKVPIIRSLNNLSENIMSQVVPSDIDPSEPIGMNEEAFKELALRDLQRESEYSGIVLSVREQQRLFRNDDQDRTSQRKKLARKDPAHSLKALAPSQGVSNKTLRAGTFLDDLFIDNDNEDSDDEDDDAKGYRKAGKEAVNNVFRAIRLRVSHAEEEGSLAQRDPYAISAATGLSVALYDRLQLTHATTTEFLHQFWLVFLSGDSGKADELAGMFESLKRAIDRIEAVAKDADEERQGVVNQKKREIREAFQRDGRKRKFDFDAIGGGATVVRRVLGPTIFAIGVAIDRYRKALALEGIDSL